MCVYDSYSDYDCHTILFPSPYFVSHILFLFISIFTLPFINLSIHYVVSIVLYWCVRIKTRGEEGGQNADTSSALELPSITVDRLTQLVRDGDTNTQCFVLSLSGRQILYPFCLCSCNVLLRVVMICLFYLPSTLFHTVLLEALHVSSDFISCSSRSLHHTLQARGLKTARGLESEALRRARVFVADNVSTESYHPLCLVVTLHNNTSVKSS